MTAAEKDVSQDENVSKNDKVAILILLVLYVLQGLPLGLSFSLRLILQNKNVSYKDQAMFSLIGWPYSLKLLWAPFVDSVYWKCMGRRKTWLISTQYILGVFMLILSNHISSYLSDTPNVYALTAVFFCIIFLCATQDIAVDGLALTMLSRKNVGFASVCNSTGLRFGIFFGNVIFLVLESPEFCNQYLRSTPQPEGLVTLSGFLKVGGIVYILTTTAILILKSEGKCEERFSLCDTYKQMYHIVCLKNVLLLIAFAMTSHVAHVAADSVSRLKFLEAGVKKESMALLEIPMMLVEVISPIYISRYAIGLNPLKIFIKLYIYKLFFSILFAFLVWWTHSIKVDIGQFSSSYYTLIALAFALHQIPAIGLFVCLGSFFNQISDPAIGGTYMTLLNTFFNLGRSCASTVALWGVDMLTYKACTHPDYSCDTKESALKCSGAGHSCSTLLDGYYLETFVCLLFGVVWLRWGQKVIHKLQNSSPSDWKTTQYARISKTTDDDVNV